MPDKLLDQYQNVLYTSCFGFGTPGPRDKLSWVVCEVALMTGRMMSPWGGGEWLTREVRSSRGDRFKNDA